IDYIYLNLAVDSFHLTAARTPIIFTPSLHDALPILWRAAGVLRHRGALSSFVKAAGSRLIGSDAAGASRRGGAAADPRHSRHRPDRKSTRLNSSHVSISYAVFCLKKKNITTHHDRIT